MTFIIGILVFLIIIIILVIIKKKYLIFENKFNIKVERTFILRKLICKCRCKKDKEYKPVEWKYRPKIEKVVKNDEIIYDNLLSPNYDNLNQEDNNKTEIDYTVVSSSIYSKFPISVEDSLSKPSFVAENEYITDKPPIDRSKFQTKMNTDVIKKDNRETNYDNI